MADDDGRPLCPHSPVVLLAKAMLGRALAAHVELATKMDPGLEVTLVVTHKDCSLATGIITNNSESAMHAALAVVEWISSRTGKSHAAEENEAQDSKPNKTSQAN